MKYEEALKMWGAVKLTTYNKVKVENIDLNTITVEFEFDEGYACCGGSDPNCYCSFYESPSAKVVITGKRTDVGKRHQNLRHEIETYNFDFATILREICEAGQGNVSL